MNVLQAGEENMADFVVSCLYIYWLDNRKEERLKGGAAGWIEMQLFFCAHPFVSGSCRMTSCAHPFVP